MNKMDHVIKIPKTINSNCLWRLFFHNTYYKMHYPSKFGKDLGQILTRIRPSKWTCSETLNSSSIQYLLLSLSTLGCFSLSCELQMYYKMHHLYKKFKKDWTSNNLDTRMTIKSICSKSFKYSKNFYLFHQP